MFDDSLKVSDAVRVGMITNNIAYWRSTMNQGKGISRAHLARQVAVGRSYVTKLEKGTAQPGADLMFRVARYFKQPMEAVFKPVDGGKTTPAIIWAKTIPYSQFNAFTSALAKPMCHQSATPPAHPAGMEAVKDKSLVVPTAKVVASLSRGKPNGKT
jgi:putative transcriptional regulator